MSMNINKALIGGRLGQKPELRHTASGASVTNLSVATSNQGVTEWHKVVVFGQPAEFICQYGDKGLEVFIEGEIRSRSWEDKKTGQTRTATEVYAHSVKLLNYKASNPPPEWQDQQDNQTA